MPVDPDRLLLMGRIGRPHGVRGEMKVFPETDDPNRLALLDRLFVGESPEAAREVTVEGVRFQYPKGRTVVLLTLDGVDTREGAEDLVGRELYADADDLPALEEGEAFLHDLVGLEVVVVDGEGGVVGEPVGTVRDLYEGAQLLFAIQRPDGTEVLLPDVDEFVDRLDLDARRLYVRPPEGLF
ncbi:ribosome maturation factor RimM [Rubrivirga sp. S365]|uniref:Ribosome maturation factor RimM n=1 Tax=Rubrivirga litoralis TaxID=3075598 RepID=A0ABU3BMT7_9BACT|nr:MULTISPECIES: ribosome maturation factor RimM [unclassified Rubrivirga]MDT0630617.1 ribosome maturation factor RimM [Rubrivirga sp. F394]MDT7857670.1 ribosome maturation factor RimM [Rubrivirga sp. S365]